MAEAPETIEGTLANGEAHAEVGLPQMNVDTYASQLFWLAITFGLLFLVLSRIAIPRIGGAIESRQRRITGDLDAAEHARDEADRSLQAYESALAAAKSRALGVAEENRKRIAAEVDKMKAEADAHAQKVTADAQARIAATCKQAEASVLAAASEAAADIVERLIGERIHAADAAKAMGSGRD